MWPVAADDGGASSALPEAASGPGTPDAGRARRSRRYNPDAGAKVAEQVDALGLDPSAARRASSSLAFRTSPAAVAGEFRMRLRLVLRDAPVINYWRGLLGSSGCGCASCDSAQGDCGSPWRRGCSFRSVSRRRRARKKAATRWISRRPVEGTRAAADAQRGVHPRFECSCKAPRRAACVFSGSATPLCATSLPARFFRNSRRTVRQMGSCRSASSLSAWIGW